MLSSLGNATLQSVMTVLTPESRLKTLDDVLELDTELVTVRSVDGTGVYGMLEVIEEKVVDRPKVEWFLCILREFGNEYEQGFSRSSMPTSSP